MSRRIAFFALAASAALIAAPASADRECFENPAGCPRWSSRPSRCRCRRCESPASDRTPRNRRRSVERCAMPAPRRSSLRPRRCLRWPAAHRRADGAWIRRRAASKPVPRVADREPARVAPRRPRSRRRASPRAAPVDATGYRPEVDSRADAVHRLPAARRLPSYAQRRRRRSSWLAPSTPTTTWCRSIPTRPIRPGSSARSISATAAPTAGRTAIIRMARRLSAVRHLRADRSAPVYMIAPSAKIISIDSDD